MSLTLDIAKDADLDYLRREARRFLDEQCPPARVREAWEHPLRYLPDLWSQVCDLGWAGLMTGAGHEDAALFQAAVLAEEMGRALYESPFVSSAIVGAFLLAESGASHLLPEIAKGSRIATFAETGARPTPSARLTRDGAQSAVSGHVPFVPYAAGAGPIILLALDESSGAPALCVAGADTPGVATELLNTMDRSPLYDLELRDVPIADTNVLATGDTATRLAERALALGAAATCVAQVGGAARSLEMATGYAMNRVQFGRPIGSFQAIKHKLADVYVSVTLARALAYAAVRAVAATESDQLAVSLAKAQCSDTFSHASRVALQVYGGLGYTWEIDVHLYLRRAATLATLYGTAQEHLDRIAASLPHRYRKTG